MQGSSPAHSMISRGGTAYFGQLAVPDWIFPFTGYGADFSTVNFDDFQWLMYRPLYWFGQVKSSSPSINPSLSLADIPTSSNRGRTAVIRLKGWRFSNGQRVDAQSVIFWMNMLMAEQENWGGSVPGGFPSNVVSYSAPDGPEGDIVTINFEDSPFREPYSTTWLLYNALPQITPMPEAWDVTSLHGRPGSGGCGAVLTGQMNGTATRAACERVWYFDTDDNGNSPNPEMSADLDTYASNPLWQVVDGPWRLSSYDLASGEVSFVPNLRYSGPQRPIISKFVEVYYTSDAALLAALARGGRGSPDLASVSTSDLPVNDGRAGTAGANAPELASRFNLNLQYYWGISYATENFGSTGAGPASALFSQLYIRQALQLLIDQPGLIRTVERGYGVPDYGPVPAFPKSPFLSKQETINPYPFNFSRAVQLLGSHGWKIVADGADVCDRAGTGPTDCGSGIPAKAKLSFMLLYPSPFYNVVPIQMAIAESSEWAKAGIQVRPMAKPSFELVGPGGDLSAPCKFISYGCSWEIVLDDGGWLFEPAYLPTGDPIFVWGTCTKAATTCPDPGSYDDRRANALIAASLASARPGQLYSYENYLAKQLPVIWQPEGVAIFEVARDLGGASPINTLGTLTPEYWYWKKRLVSLH